ncbi:MAG: hypothetical protein KatS3mg119_1709 [Rhodothalassiaceae bacterium]|nr:MAG: hypothetical protein KatS3mg119_1709 [Rhodothalassiaceae bacterium]
MAGRRAVIILVLVLAAVLAGALFLYFWDIPAPQQMVEKTIPDDRLPH